MTVILNIVCACVCVINGPTREPGKSVSSPQRWKNHTYIIYQPKFPYNFKMFGKDKQTKNQNKTKLQYSYLKITSFFVDVSNI